MIIFAFFMVREVFLYPLFSCGIENCMKNQIFLRIGMEFKMLAWSISCYFSLLVFVTHTNIRFWSGLAIVTLKVEGIQNVPFLLTDHV